MNKLLKCIGVGLVTAIVSYVTLMIITVLVFVAITRYGEVSTWKLPIDPSTIVAFITGFVVSVFWFAEEEKKMKEYKDTELLEAFCELKESGKLPNEEMTFAQAVEFLQKYLDEKGEKIPPTP